MGSVGSSNHLTFDKLPLEKGRKLHKYKVRNHDLYETIGEIHWRGGWRQYVFQAIIYYPNAIETINGKKYIHIENIIKIDMSKGCHKQIDEFIDGLMEEWKESRKKKNVKAKKGVQKR